MHRSTGGQHGKSALNTRRSGKTKSVFQSLQLLKLRTDLIVTSFPRDVVPVVPDAYRANMSLYAGIQTDSSFVCDGRLMYVATRPCSSKQTKSAGVCIAPENSRRSSAACYQILRR